MKPTVKQSVATLLTYLDKSQRVTVVRSEKQVLFVSSLYDFEGFFIVHTSCNVLTPVVNTIIRA